MFYPGARVDSRAYLPLLRPVAEAGYLAVVLKTPFGMPILHPQQGQHLFARPGLPRRWVAACHRTLNSCPSPAGFTPTSASTDPNAATAGPAPPANTPDNRSFTPASGISTRSTPPHDPFRRPQVVTGQPPRLAVSLGSAPVRFRRGDRQQNHSQPELEP